MRSSWTCSRAESIISSIGILCAVFHAPLILASEFDKEAAQLLSNKDQFERDRGLGRLIGWAWDNRNDPATAAKVTPLFLNALKDTSPLIRGGAAGAFNYLQENEKPVDPAVINGVATLLKDKDLGVRQSAAIALSKFGKRAMPAKDALLEAFKDKSNHQDDGRSISTSLRKSLENLGADLAVRQASGEVQKELDEQIQRLKNTKEDKYDRSGAIGNLAAIALKYPEAKDQAIAEMLKAETNTDPEVRRELPGQFDKIFTEAPEIMPKVVECIGRLLLEKNEGVRNEAAYTLDGWGAKSGSAFSSLHTVLKSASAGDLNERKNSEFYRHVISCLAKLGSSAKEALPELQKLVKHGNYGSRAKDAITAISK